MIQLSGSPADFYIYPFWIKDTLSKTQVRKLITLFPREKRKDLTYFEFCRVLAEEDATEHARQLWNRIQLIPFPNEDTDNYLRRFLKACDAMYLRWDEEKRIMRKVPVIEATPVIAPPTVVKPFNQPKFYRLMLGAFLGLGALFAFFILLLIPLLNPGVGVETPVPVATTISSPSSSRNLDTFGMTQEEAGKFLTAFKSFSKIPTASRSDALKAYEWKQDFKRQLGLKGKISADSSNEAVRKALVEDLLNKHGWDLNKSWAEIE